MRQIAFILLCLSLLFNSCYKWVEKAKEDLTLDQIPSEIRQRVDKFCKDSTWSATYWKGASQGEYYIGFSHNKDTVKAPSVSMLHELQQTYIPALKTNVQEQILQGNPPGHYKCLGIKHAIIYEDFIFTNILF